MRGGIIALVFCVPLLLVAGGYAWTRDEPVSAEVSQWQQQVQLATGESRAYLYLSGLDAPVDQQPEALGAMRLQHYERWIESREDVTDVNFVAPVVPVITLPEGELFCSIEAAGCFETLLAQAGELAATDDKHRVLRERYQDLLALSDYRTLTSISLAEPIPPLIVMSKGQQLFNLHVLDLALNGQGAVAQASLQLELAQLRWYLARADNLVLKMLMGSLVSRNLEWQARLYRRGLTTQPAFPAPFNEAERSLLMPMQREFFGIAQMYEHLKDSVSGYERFAQQLFFRPQMTINAALAPYLRGAQLSQLAPDDFAVALDEQPPVQPEAGGLRNSVGNILLRVGTPEMPVYVGRIQDLEAKRRLLVVLATLPPGEFDEGHLQWSPAARNPYYPTRQAKPDGRGQLCFDGPLQAFRNGRCVPL